MITIMKHLNTLWHEIFAGSNFCGFCDFSSHPQNKNYRKKIFPKYLVQSEYSQEPMTHRLLSANLNSPHKYSTKKSCLFNDNLSLSFRNKTVYNEILVYS